MKRWIALLLAVLMILSLTACGKTTGPSLAEQMENRPETEQPPVSSKPKPSQPVKPEQPDKKEEPKPEVKPEEPAFSGDYTAYDGTYRSKERTEEGEEMYLVVRGFPDFLMIETYVAYEGSTYSFWVEEFWPDEGTVLGESRTLHGKSQTFSIMTRGHLYTEMPLDREITLTADGISLQFEGKEPEEYVRDDTYSYHTSEEELVKRLNEMFTLTQTPELEGIWTFWDGWRTVRIELEEDGGFHFISKEPGLPVFVYDGAWGVDADTGDIQITAELAGDGQYPYVVTWQWRLEDGEYLYLTDEYGFILRQLGNDYAFWRSEGDWTLNLTQPKAMGYVWDTYDRSGEYTDQYGTDYYYYYRLPEFFEDNDDLVQINTEIREKFAAIIEEELAAMEIGEFITAENVDYNLFITEDIVTVYIHSFSWEWEEHQTYYYDLRTNSRTDSRELLHRIGVDEEEFLETVRDAAEAYFIETFSGVPEADRQAYGYYDFLEWTVSDEAVNFDLPIYVDAVGNLCVMARIGSLAGASYFWTPLYPFADFAGYDDAVG